MTISKNSKMELPKLKTLLVVLLKLLKIFTLLKKKKCKKNPSIWNFLTRVEFPTLHKLKIFLKNSKFSRLQHCSEFSHRPKNYLIWKDPTTHSTRVLSKPNKLNLSKAQLIFGTFWSHEELLCLVWICALSSHLCQ